MTDAKGYVDANFLAAAAKLIRPVKTRSYELMQLQAGQRVLDVGCGPGTDTIPLAEHVGAMGHIVGIDHDADMIAKAEQQAREAGVRAWVTHHRAAATSLPFADRFFDACRSERLFQHLREPDRAFVEMRRVTKPDGWVVVIDTDTATVSIDSDEIDLERRLCRFYSDHRVWNGYAGRQLYRRFKQHDMRDIYIEIMPVTITDYGLWRYIDLSDTTEREAVAAGVLTQEELQRYRENLEQVAAADSFFAQFNLVMVAGRRP